MNDLLIYYLMLTIDKYLPDKMLKQWESGEGE